MTRTTIALAAALLVATPAGAQPPPSLTAPVNDFAGVIGAAEEKKLDDIILTLQAATGDVIVVATVKTFQPAADIRMYANEMFENGGRGIGQKGKDNGMLVVLAVDDRDVWAEVGYDLEGIIPDGFAGQTSRDTMVPFFRQGNYGGGLLAGVTVFANRIAEARNVTLEGVPARQPSTPGGSGGGGFPGIFILILLFMVMNVLRTVFQGLTGRGRRRRGRWGSAVGPFGAGYGGWHMGGRGGGWGGGGGFGGGFGGFGGGRSGGGGGGASW